MVKSYNLLYEPWIVALNTDGSTEKYGIKGLFENAHNVLDIKSPNFNGSEFLIYESLVLRLLSAIYSDAMALLENGYYGEESKVESLALDVFDVSEDSPLGTYFSKYASRFDLFSASPFMQATDSDLENFKNEKLDPTSVMKLNPTAIAADGRLFGAGLNNESLLNTMDSFGDTLIGLINSDLDFDKKKYKEVICDYYKLTPEHLAYLLLYAHTYAPNVRIKGSLLCDISYTQMMKGKDLKTTIILNSQCVTDEDTWNVPLWRWNSIMDGITRAREGNGLECGVLSTLFYPSRAIRAYLSDDGFVRDIVLTSVFVTDEDKKLYDGFKTYCQWELEPYLAKKWTYSKKKSIEDNLPRPIKSNDEAPQWMRIIQSSCGMTLDMVKSIMELEGADELLLSPKEFYRTIIDNKGAISKYGIRACIYYLVQGEHSKLLTSGKSESDISEEIFTSPLKTQMVEKMCNLIRASSLALKKAENEYLGSKNSSLIKVFNYKCETLMGVSIQNLNGFFFKVEKAETNEDIESVFEEFRLEVIKIAKNVFNRVMDSNRLLEYFKIEKSMVNFIKYYGKRGEENGNLKKSRKSQEVY